MRFDCKKFIKYVEYVKQTENDREIDKKKNVSMQKMQIRIFLIWLRFIRKSNQLICEKIRYFQFFLIEFLFFLIEFLFCKIENVMIA